MRAGEMIYLVISFGVIGRLCLPVAHIYQHPSSLLHVGDFMESSHLLPEEEVVASVSTDEETEAQSLSGLVRSTARI